MTFQEYRKKGFKGSLIPVHINKCRDNTHYWDWSSDIGDWVRGKEISEEKRNCGTSWFNDLPSEEESEEVEIGRSEVPHEVDSIIDDMLEEDNA